MECRVAVLIGEKKNKKKKESEQHACICGVFASLLSNFLPCILGIICSPFSVSLIPPLFIVINVAVKHTHTHSTQYTSAFLSSFSAYTLRIHRHVVYLITSFQDHVRRLDKHLLVLFCSLSMTPFLDHQQRQVTMRLADEEEKCEGQVLSLLLTIFIISE